MAMGRRRHGPGANPVLTTTTKASVIHHQPSTHHIIHINDHRIAYDQRGEGRSVVLIHGIPTSRLLWRKVMPALAKTHQVMAEVPS